MKAIILKTGKVVGLGILFVWGLWIGINGLATLSDKLHDEVTVYGASCSRVQTNYYECSNMGGHLDPDKRVFKANFDRQFVVKKESFGTDKFTDCSVYDNYNWHCRIESGNSIDIISMRDGRLSYPQRWNPSDRVSVLLWEQTDRTLNLIQTVQKWFRMFAS